ncbi:AIPR family protein [Ignatzschineria cameli]|uniref:Abortive phage infection protein C-terminal domain-containing protein n=1 Tax=Ignatzschineria cameli TaxID=2182793 RepID=A0A2U2AL98_9GAMM|nr:AIPR family protein [Ignatzschineria cameli]PWD83640.1 hypothetical protein DC080_08105 [Ignatzschineria cameli]PWD83994.1 hypothetical protein DC077_08260 [Ignatzschineria cameli]
MSNKKTISHPIINSYVEEFSKQYEIESNGEIDAHKVFEDYINNLVLSVYCNDPNASYLDMETGSAIGIDGIAIFVADKLITSISDVEYILDEVKKFDVSFYFIQSKTSPKFDRHSITDFLSSIRRFFDFSSVKCNILELQEFWEIAKFIFSKATRFKGQPKLNTFYITLSANNIDLKDPHLSHTIGQSIQDINDLNLFEPIKKINFIGIQEIMTLNSKLNTELEVVIKMAKTPLAYPKDQSNKVKNGYYGLIQLTEFIKILTEDIDGNKVLRRHIFDDNIRYYLGSDEKIEVNATMKEQITGDRAYLFGMLNNGITVIADEINLSSEELSLKNYQIVNGCQTSNVIFEVLNDIHNNSEDIYLPIRFIATEDEETKSSIIKATNSQTTLKPEQLAALSSIQKAIEQYYETKKKSNNFDLFYERRTEQFRDDNVQKTKIITIPLQIKSTSAMFLDLPDEVSGQYGKVERSTRGSLFQDNHLAFLNTYYVSGLAWYRVDRFIRTNEEGKKARRARWHLMMLLKYLLCDHNLIYKKIDRHSEEASKKIEKKLLDEEKCNSLIMQCLNIIKECLKTHNIDYVLDRKTFERKETTTLLIQYIKQKK